MILYELIWPTSSDAHPLRTLSTPVVPAHRVRRPEPDLFHGLALDFVKAVPSAELFWMMLSRCWPKQTYIWCRARRSAGVKLRVSRRSVDPLRTNIIRTPILA
ncbi:hypothetical protein [Bradyrhizobium glycinis]|uniref:hypothetical protein n=1 Tax=Bradyrhizobium glycinis TaxID=2751812 RepID=UPI0018D943FD|nr:hypothetical protein [Bradyrhizobium glycinis]MBH5371120.1 hypothetical protein [Bradyrhizobium glycinis]